MFKNYKQLNSIVNDHNHYKLKLNESLAITRANQCLRHSAVVLDTNNTREDSRHNIMILDDNAILLYTDDTNQQSIKDDFKSIIHKLAIGVVELELKYVSEEYLIDTEFQLLGKLADRYLLDIRMKVQNGFISDAFINAHASYDLR